MKVSQLVFSDRQWRTPGESSLRPRPSDTSRLVLAFGDRHALESPAPAESLRALFPEAELVFCSSGGEIAGERVLEGSIVATAIEFESPRSRAVAVTARLHDRSQSDQIGRDLGCRLLAHDLRHVFVVSEGLNVNGSALAAGFTRILPPGVAVTGGLSADGERFEKTLVGLNGAPESGMVVAIGLYGPALRIGMGTLGGWETFGEPHLVTRADGNVVMELDGEPALAVYRRLIGAHAYALPASGLLFPFELQSETGDSSVVRTLLGVDHVGQTLTFAGDVPEGRTVHVMAANLDRLIDAAGEAAGQSHTPLRGASPTLALLVSCIGRRLLLQKRVAEEIGSVRRAFGLQTALAGFYSYGELSPMTPSARCELHNQTMTITTLSEA